MLVRPRISTYDQEPVSGNSRIDCGKLTFWNAKPEDIIAPIIDHNLPYVTEVRNAIITPREIDPKIQGHRRGLLRFATGGIYDRDLHLLPVFRDREEFEISEKATNRLRNEPILSEYHAQTAQNIPGQCIYMGILRGHFGHFLLESLSRMWYILKSDSSVRIIVHGDVKIGNLPSYVRHVFKLLDLDPGRIIVATRTMVVENLIFPQSEFEIRWKAHSSFADIFREMFERNARILPNKYTGKRIYFTRRQLKIKNVRDHRKAVNNEEQVEEFFSAKGFEIIAPEKLPFDEQIALIGGANQIAGLKGSALHMSLFCQRPQPRIIQIGRNQSMNQCLIDGLKDMESHHIMCESSKSDSGSVVDVEIIRAAMRGM